MLNGMTLLVKTDGAVLSNIRKKLLFDGSWAFFATAQLLLRKEGPAASAAMKERLRKRPCCHHLVYLIVYYYF